MEREEERIGEENEGKKKGGEERDEKKEKGGKEQERRGNKISRSPEPNIQ